VTRPNLPRNDKPRAVAVLVHNEVLKDARVLKEVETLGAAGHIVDVIGASPTPGDYPATVPGARSLTIVDISPKSLQGRFYKIADNYYPLLLDYLIILAGLLPVFLVLHYSTSPEELAANFVWLSPLLLLSIKSMKSNTADRYKIRRLTMTGFSVLLIAASVYATLVDRIGIVTFLIVLSLLFLIQRTSFNLRRFSYSLLVKLRTQRVTGYRKDRYYAIAQQLAGKVDQSRHNTIHCHDIIALIAGTYLKKRNRRLRLIWDAHEYYEEVASGTPEDRALVREVIKDAESRVDDFVTISESFREIYRREYPKLPPARVVMNATRNAGAVADDGRLHAAAGLSPDRSILLFQGGFSPHRGIGQLLQAARNLPEPWSIVMMGWGKLEAEIEAAIDELINPDRPELAPLAMIPAAPQDELPYWSAGATLGVIPYENTGMNHLHCTPNKLWEFPNAGVPILATSLVEMERIIRQWGTGFLMPRDFTARDIIDALVQITPEALSEAKANCRRFSDAMSWDQFEDELLKAYE
jgi:glycosyltransferase involved in cell wall biosynthesis